MLSRESGNRLPATLSAGDAAKILREKVLRIFFQQGFFKIRAAQLQVSPVSCELLAGFL